MGSVNVSIIYYSATGTVHALARAAAEGAEKAGARARLRKVAETAPMEMINAHSAWSQQLRDSADVAEACPDDVAWADAVPSRDVALEAARYQVRHVVDTTAALKAGRGARPRSRTP
jgi:NAD(P)H dehydrogenase (quinone)